jgi:hypothetical protein
MKTFLLLMLLLISMITTKGTRDLSFYQTQPTPQPTPTSTHMRLKFTNGETLRYQASVTVDEEATSQGSTSGSKLTGSHIIAFKVTQVAAGKATMSVSYANPRATAKIINPPKGATTKDISQLEKMLADGLKASLGRESRTQITDPRGSTTYTFKGNNQSTTVSSGAFLMIILPQNAVSVGATWSAKVRTPQVPATDPITINYKLVANDGKTARISLSGSDKANRSGDQGKIDGTLTMSGTAVLDIAKGKLTSVQIVRQISTKITPKEGASVTSKQTTTQNLKLS